MEAPRREGQVAQGPMNRLLDHAGVLLGHDFINKHNVMAARNFALGTTDRFKSLVKSLVEWTNVVIKLDSSRIPHEDGIVLTSTDVLLPVCDEASRFILDTTFRLLFRVESIHTGVKVHALGVLARRQPSQDIQLHVDDIVRW